MAITGNGVSTPWLYLLLRFASADASTASADCVDRDSIPRTQSAEIFAALQITVPPRSAEQTAIAAVLSDMDAEIAALEAKLAKARQVKQGMMQELLTGRIRLI